MRQVLSWRLLAAVGALVALAVLVTLALTGRDSIAEITEPDEPTARVADVAALVLDTQVQNFAIGPDGRSTGDLVMKLAPPYDVTVRVFPGTPGSNDCPSLGEFGLCSLLAEMHGDTIAAFSIVPTGARFTFELPAIVELDGGYAQLVDGWRVPYAKVIDRSQCDSPAESFSEFLRLNGTDHSTVFSIGEGAITDVVC
jgi:hypothetical protein